MAATGDACATGRWRQPSGRVVSKSSQPHAEFLRAATDVWRQRLGVQLAVAPKKTRGGPVLAARRAALTRAVAGAHSAAIALAAPQQCPAVAAVLPAYLAYVTPRLAGHAPAAAALPPPPDEVVLRSHVLEWLMRHTARAQPDALVGALYALAEPLRMLEVVERGEPRGEAAAPWARFEAVLDAVASGDTGRARASTLAQELLAELVAIVDALEPRAPRTFSQLVGVLNPAAGKHAIPGDLEEICAAVRAGDRTWAEFPYYQLRYASRGIRYTWSDSAWLVTLCELPQAQLESQVAWLGRLLATRGMPQWLLERHLVYLHDELTRTLPARAVHYAPLARAAANLRATRVAHVGEALGAELTAALSALVKPALVQTLPEAGRLLAAALADERAGITGALPSLLGWLADPERFPPEWVDAVRQVVQRASE